MQKSTWGLLLLALAPTACSPPPASVPAPAVAAERHDAKPIAAGDKTVPIAAPGAAPAGPAAVPAPAPISVAEAWVWLRAELPEEASRLRPFDPTEDLLGRLLGWAAPGKTIDVYDRSCRRLRLVRDDASLNGTIHEKTVTRGKTKTESGESIELGDHITLLCGFSHGYERTRDGWRENAVSATGCAAAVGHRLSQVTDTAAWYGGELVSIAVKCTLRTQREQRCRDGSVRTCTSCEELRMEVASPASRTAWGSAQARASAGPSPVDCAAPCPPDEKGTRLAQVNAALAGVKLLQVGMESHPTLFRTRAACLAYASTHAMSAADRPPW
ncbi:MAG: hypothetical protein HY744_12145 [Deltaproteobacteria bacterium]|nr:hypothetical protein [Deltaproteobacteria bacterium]